MCGARSPISWLKFLEFLIIFAMGYDNPEIIGWLCFRASTLPWDIATASESDPPRSDRKGQLVQVPGSANCRHLQARSAHELRLLAFYIFRRSRNNQKNIIFMAHGNYVNSNFGVDKGNDIGSRLPPSLT